MRTLIVLALLLAFSAAAPVASASLTHDAASVKYDDGANALFVGCIQVNGGSPFAVCGAFTHVLGNYGPGAGVYRFGSDACVSARAGFGTPVANECGLPGSVLYNDGSNAVFAGCAEQGTAMVCGSFTHALGNYGPGAGAYLFSDHACAAARAGFGTPVANACEDGSAAWLFLS